MWWFVPCPFVAEAPMPVECGYVPCMVSQVGLQSFRSTVCVVWEAHAHSCSHVCFHMAETKRCVHVSALCAFCDVLAVPLGVRWSLGHGLRWSLIQHNHYIHF